MRTGRNGEKWQTTVTIPFIMHKLLQKKGLKINRILRQKLSEILYHGGTTIQDLKEANAVLTNAFDKNNEKLIKLENEIRQFRLLKKFEQERIRL